MKVLILDGYNLIYRARHSIPRWHKENEYSIIYSFFRSLRPIIEKFNPDKVYFVTEGYPKMRLEASSEYKGTRPREKDQNFKNQKSEIISLLVNHFPIEVIRHPEYECDDVIGFLAKDKHREDECVVVSTDTDFIQLLNTPWNIQIYNPIRKSFVSKPNFDYVQWKALRGDSCDNISGFRGIGDKRATALIESSEKLEEFLDAELGRKEKFEHNIFMIKFHDMRSIEHEFERSSSIAGWDNLKHAFEKMEFKSIINDKSWDKFKNTFSKLEC